MKHKKSMRLLSYIVVIVFLLIYLFPVYWQIITSIKTRVDCFAMPPRWIFKPTLDNYRDLFNSYQMAAFLRNSIIVALLSTAISMLFGCFCGYGLARYSFSRKKDLSFWLLSIRMAPPIAISIPFYLLWRQIGLYDTYLGLALIYVTNQMPFVIWFMRTFFEEIPTEVEEAALIDGASRLTAFRRISMKLALPGIAATAIFCIILSWNEFMFALLLTGRNTKTLPVVSTTFVSDMGIQWGQLCAMSTIIMIPLLIFAMFMQKYLISGLTFGAVKE